MSGSNVINHVAVMATVQRKTAHRDSTLHNIGAVLTSAFCCMHASHPSLGYSLRKSAYQETDQLGTQVKLLHHVVTSMENSKIYICELQTAMLQDLSAAIASD